MKKGFKITFFVCLSVILLLAVPIVYFVVAAEWNVPDSVGIIGGADGPTVIFVASTTLFESPVFFLLCLAAAGLIVSGAGWAFSGKK